MRQRLAVIFGALGALVTFLTAYRAFFVVGEVVNEAGISDFSARIVYIHVPVAETSLVAVLVGAVGGALYLTRRKHIYAIMSRCAIELALLFGIGVEVSGMIWDRAAWGVWWTWEPRLTTYLILMLVYGGYFVLRSSVEDEGARERYAAVYSIVGAVTAPFTFFAIRLLESVHPVIFKIGQQIDPSIMQTFILGMFGMLSLFVALLLTRIDMEDMREELEETKNRLELQPS